MKSLLRVSVSSERAARGRLLLRPLRAASTSAHSPSPAVQNAPAAKPPTPIRYTSAEGKNAKHRSNECQSATLAKLDQSAHRNYQFFQALVHSRFRHLRQYSETDYTFFGLESEADVNRQAALFIKAVNTAFRLATDRAQTSREQNPLFWNLRNAFVKGDTRGLTSELKYSFESFLIRNRFPKAVTELHEKIADLRYPYEWYPATRMMQRTIHVHVGPTNSGKTYNALKALEGAKSGIYAGPLRLLAHEIYTRMEAKGLPCALITGEEQRFPEGVDSHFASCTVEMTPLNRPVDVAVIDEIQMIADDDRGWAWTQAFLGVQAKEVHLCGEERAVDLIKELAARMGDKCVVHNYKRLNALHTMNDSLKGDFSNLQKGDCVVSFTRLGLHKLKKGIEESTGRRCAIVYGSLPPETRAQQAALFNDQDNDYDFLVASDAIGMGLNLEIKRVIFETAFKFDGQKHRSLTVWETKQIGGRAGRFKTASQANKAAATGQTESAATTQSSNGWAMPGFVTTLDDEDLSTVAENMEQNVIPIKTAGIKPPPFLVEKFSAQFPPTTPQSFILLRLREMCRLSSRFHLCDDTDEIEVLDRLQNLPLTLPDRLIIMTTPVVLKDFRCVAALRGIAEVLAYNKSGHICDIDGIDLDILELDMKNSKLTKTEYLLRLESLHKQITMYLWLSYRFEGVFQSQHLAFHIKSLVEAKIATLLTQFDFTAEAAQIRRSKLRKIAKQNRVLEHTLIDENEAEGQGEHGEGPGVWKEEGHEEPLIDLDELDRSLDDGSKQPASTPAS
ncbi:P-loop containing nucleoside triphosphate hydrolase protein [Cercophora newfieldiana]|uniref:RNA helicase n=1 Tax=Cercophora newfieldiana TaxID=92897 RepID=A0AA39Y080_9PEZI|nr:P-loop containing nucleoside triphosphate hydrolase protein [Cercophora newfieldiana]